MDSDAFFDEFRGELRRGLVVSAYAESLEVVIPRDGAHSDAPDADEVDGFLCHTEVRLLCHTEVRRTECISGGHQFVRLVADDLCGVGEGHCQAVFLHCGDFLRIPEQFEGRREEFFRRLGILYDEGCVFADERHRVVRLVVFGHVGRRDEDDGFSEGAEFRDGRGPAPGDHDIRRRVGEVHPLDEVEMLHRWGGMLREEGIHTFLIIFTALPDHFQVFSARASSCDPGFHRPVEGAAAEAAADDEKVFLRRIQSVEGEGFRLHFRRCRNGHFLADGIAAEDDFLLREESLHSLVGHADAPGLLSEDLVGESGKSVLLLDQRRNSHPGGRPEQGSAGIAAHADGDVRLEFADNPARLAHASEHLEGCLDVIDDILPVQLSLESHNGESDDFIAGSRHFLHFHLAFGTDEKDFALRVEFPHLVGNRDGRENMPSRAAAADNDPNLPVFHIYRLST